MDLTEYSLNSPFVQEYAIKNDGLSKKYPESNVIDTSEKVVIVDALLRKYYNSLSTQELTLITGLDESDISEVLDQFETENIVELENDSYMISKQNNVVESLRDIQIELLRF